VRDLTDLIVNRTETLSGSVKAPPSKAHTHRAVIAGSLSDGRSMIKEALVCDDTVATIKACRMVGAEIDQDKTTFRVDGISKPNTPENVIDCGESGTTIRFLTPVCALAEGISVLTGNESLRERPMKPLLEALEYLGVNCYSARSDGFPPIIVFGGGIKGGKAAIRGDVSSQYISGLLFATPMAEDKTEIHVTTQLESKPYVAMTLDVLSKHGIRVDSHPDYMRFTVPPDQKYVPSSHSIEGDYSSAAFLMAAAAITNSKVRITGLKRETLQGDKAIVDILKDMGSLVEVGEEYIEVRGVERGLRGIKIDLSDNPDLVPVCAVLASSAGGRTDISGVKRLRFKESDRILSLSSELGKMGIKVTAFDDKMIIEGGKMQGVILNSHNDHRIAMACTVAALRSEAPTVVHGIECVSKSYPNFVEDLRLLGGNVFEQ